MRAVRCLNCIIATGTDRVNTARAVAQETSDKIFTARDPVEGLNCTTGDEIARVAGLVEGDFVCVLVGHYCSPVTE